MYSLGFLGNMLTRHGIRLFSVVRQGTYHAPVDRDPYDVLGVSRSASADELKAAYRALARELHPDVNDDPDAAQKFTEVQQAWDLLSDPEKKAMYDRHGRVGSPAGGFGGGAGIDPARFSEIFEDLFGGGGGGGHSPFGGQPRSQPRPQQGADHRKDLHVTFVTAVRGGTETIKLDNGTSMDLRIPAGIDDGRTLRVRGKGGPGGNGGAPGDLLVTVRVGGHPLFRRDGLHLRLDVPVTLAEAITGTAVELDLLSGTVVLRIPPGTSSGTKLRVAGHGVSAADDRSGDLLATVMIVAPAEITDAMKQAAAQIDLPDPRAGIDGMRTVSE